VRHLLPAALFCLLAAGSPARAADAFTLRDGDRVVLLGNTLIEREQQTGCWESALTRRFPGANVQFRNLGWSGDTVFGEARAGFGTAADGFKHLKEHVLALKPTVILVAYGSNEAFDGEKGLPRFVQGLNTLLDTLAPTKARIVLLSPLPQEDLGRPLPDPTAQNKNLRLYTRAIREVAEKRGFFFMDLFDLLAMPEGKKSSNPLTDNGIHLTPWGYWYTAPLLEGRLGVLRGPWFVWVDAGGKLRNWDNARVEKVERDPLRFRVTDVQLPLPPAPQGSPAGVTAERAGRALKVTGLPPGRYTLRVDGKPVATADATQWAEGMWLERGPEFEQSERLRQTIVAKNRLYFHRWRPQNETYLFGFRKAEQGQNAREVPQFDPLVARKEAEIARLRVPAAHTYELKQEKP
jgi:lysophospholipase L1-like esterase